MFINISMPAIEISTEKLSSTFILKLLSNTIIKDFNESLILLKSNSVFIYIDIYPLYK